MTSAKKQLIISADVLPHPVLEHDIIEPGRARKDMGIGMEQRGTGYRVYEPRPEEAQDSAEQSWQCQVRTGYGQSNGMTSAVQGRVQSGARI